MGRKRIAITCGDPSGLGPELIERCLVENRYEGAEFVLFGPGNWIDSIVRRSDLAVSGESLSEQVFEAGQPNPKGAKVAMAAMEAAARSCLEGRCDAVVTGPIAKSLCAEVGYEFPGQTEFFAYRWGGEPTMAFVGERLALCLATWHIPLAEVPEALTRPVFERAVEAAHMLGKRLGRMEPRVIVCGLNPHAGEDGLLGSEEKERLNPWLDALRARLTGSIEGCVPGDTAFARAMKGEADVVVATYHDQGLAPFKAVDFDSGVNVTLGLPHLRVSPDHGTGFGIAGKGIASPGSTSKAIELAIRL
ncbi:4-hydroxythreonine-4-phosphate dehydrogenase PdxA [Pelagicoccus sp. SDUM812003]|uniref:4-hydroxythreonine-4-phosphate dehydrogenase PdxA n=1 Tax=Pelagicoccus sp. SDUM812003 TaxID=3041267 RepID=UPI00281087EF|nr:4-hydroxythreonine-4-phosphate dehydrogenase PdxA [Pelagicoccus sp. SDUM812003]MDQ8202021.1 4-hydroxythreonine-4-phosphate dehydrogenase PdxA [Pelagicoccus sp. SDUM812003]